MLVDTKLRDNISDMIAYEKHTGATDGGGQDGKLKDHFEELREKQRLAQREFHQKLFTELQKEVGFDKRVFPKYFSTVFSQRSVLMVGPGKVQWLRLWAPNLSFQSITSSSPILNLQDR